MHIEDNGHRKRAMVVKKERWVQENGDGYIKRAMGTSKKQWAHIEGDGFM